MILINKKMCDHLLQPWKAKIPLAQADIFPNKLLEHKPYSVGQKSCFKNESNVNFPKLHVSDRYPLTLRT